jgi:hypothetical protein
LFWNSPKIPESNRREQTVAFSARARTRGFGSELIFDLGRGRAVAEQVLLGQLAAGGRHRGG